MSACGVKLHDYYAGIVVDEFGKPIENVSVNEDLIDKYAGKTKTDKNGFFKLKASTLRGLIPNKLDILLILFQWFGTRQVKTTEYSPLITQDSSKHELKKINGKELKFVYHELKNKPDFFKINQSKT